MSTRMTPSMAAILRTQNAVFQGNSLTKQAEGYNSADLMAQVSPPWQAARQTAATEFASFRSLVAGDTNVTALTATTAKEMADWIRTESGLYHTLTETRARRLTQRP